MKYQKNNALLLVHDTGSHRHPGSLSARHGRSNAVEATYHAHAHAQSLPQAHLRPLRLRSKDHTQRILSSASSRSSPSDPAAHSLRPSTPKQVLPGLRTSPTQREWVPRQPARSPQKSWVARQRTAVRRARAAHRCRRSPLWPCPSHSGNATVRADQREEGARLWVRAAAPRSSEAETVLKRGAWTTAGMSSGVC